MTIHTIIESCADYETIREQDPTGDRIWWSTGGGVLEDISRRGETAVSLEAKFPQESFDRLAKAGYLYTETLRQHVNRLCPWRNGADIGLCLAFFMNQCFFTTLYKGALLDQLREEATATDTIECVGDPDAIDQESISMRYGRFDTVFAFIADALGDAGVSVKRNSSPKEDLIQKDNAIVYRRMSFVEKFLSILNNTPGSFGLKLWRRAVGQNWFPIKSLRFWPAARRQFAIHGSCELLDETFFALLFRGAHLRLLPQLPTVRASGDDAQALPNENAIRAACHDSAMAAFREYSAKTSPISEVCIGIVADRLLAALRKLHADWQRFEAACEEVISELQNDACILTGGFTTVDQRLFYEICKKRGLKVAAFEHGLTMGLSRWSDYCDLYYPLRHADVGVYHNDVSAIQMKRILPNQKRIIAGLPRVTTSGAGSRAINRFLIRRWLNISQKEHVVMYVADLEKNNYVYGPYAENDFQYQTKTVDITRTLCKKYPNSTILLKLYPTDRYIDGIKFTDLRQECDNLSILRDIDLRFVAPAADLIITTSSQSTLGWTIGSGSPCLFAEFKWAPVKFDGPRRHCLEIPGLTAFIEVNTEGFIPHPTPDFAAYLFD